MIARTGQLPVADNPLANSVNEEALEQQRLQETAMRKSKVVLSDLNAGGDGSTVLTFKNSAQYTAFCVETLTGSVRVIPSLDGDNFTSQQLALAQEPTITSDTPGAQTGTLVGKTTAGVLAWFFGDMRSYKFVQVGATGAQIRLRASGDFE